MTKIYSYELSISDLTRLQKDMNKIIELLEDNAFKEFLAKKMEEGLQFIQNNSFPIESEQGMDFSVYMTSNHVEIGDDYIYIYNDATIDVASLTTFFDETSKMNYPAKLSLAKIVEYGIGYTGASFTPQDEVEDWTYDVKGHGYKGWYYKGPDGKPRWTNGFVGRLVFYKLSLFVKAYISNWINEYLNEKL